MESMIITVIDKNKPIDDWIFEKRKIFCPAVMPHTPFQSPLGLTE